MTIPPLPELQLVGVEPTKAGLEGRRMSYMAAGGDGAPPAVLLHGIGSNSTGWRYVIDGLRRDWRVVAWNAPGYYLSDNLAAETPDIAQYADALAALLDALGIGAVCLAGSSFGSVVAMSFAARYPDRVRRLALLGAARGHGWLPAEERARRLEPRAESIRDGPIALGETRWRALIAPDASATTIRLVQDVLKATNPRGYLQSTRAIDAADVLDFVGAIRAPTLMMVGAADQVTPPATSRAVRDAIAGARLVELDGIGHLPKLEAPGTVVRLLREHFSA